METRTVDEVEILRTGKWKGLEWTEEDLDHVVANFENGVASIPLKITDNGDHDGSPMVLPGGAALGWVEKLKRNGNKLVARIKQVPKLVAELWQNGGLAKKSVEGYVDFETTDGEKHGKTLTGLLLFGGEGFPAVHGLSDLVKVYKLEKARPLKFGFAYTEDDYQKPPHVGETPTNPKRESQNSGGRDSETIAEGGNLRTMDIKQEDYQVLLKIQAEHEVLKSENEKLKKELAEVTLKAENSETRCIELKAKVEESEEIKRKAARKEAADFAHKLVEEGKIQTSEEESVCEAIQEKDGEDRIAYKDRLSKRPSVYGEQVTNPEPESSDKKEGWDNLHERALKLQAAGGISYKQALDAVMLQEEGTDG